MVYVMVMVWCRLKCFPGCESRRGILEHKISQIPDRLKWEILERFGCLNLHMSVTPLQVYHSVPFSITPSDMGMWELFLRSLLHASYFVKFPEPFESS